MKKKDLLLADFENLEIKAIHKITGGIEVQTNDACTSGDVGCCDTDTKNIGPIFGPVEDQDTGDW